MPETFMKRQKARDRQERQRAKAEKRAQKRATGQARPVGEPGEDPDLIGIVPGPQPIRDEDAN
jgi:hypothetical protein